MEMSYSHCRTLYWYTNNPEIMHPYHFTTKYNYSYLAFGWSFGVYIQLPQWVLSHVSLPTPYRSFPLETIRAPMIGRRALCPSKCLEIACVGSFDKHTNIWLLSSAKQPRSQDLPKTIWWYVCHLYRSVHHKRRTTDNRAIGVTPGNQEIPGRGQRTTKLLVQALEGEGQGREAAMNMQREAVLEPVVYTKSTADSERGRRSDYKYKKQKTCTATSVLLHS